MRKTGKNKAVAMLIVVAMVIGMLPMGVLPAFAADPSTITPTSAPSANTLVAGTASTTITAQAAADIKVQEISGNLNKWPSGDSTIEVTIETTGVAFSAKPTVKLNGNTLSTSLPANNKLTFAVNGTSDVRDVIDITGIKYDIGNVGSATEVVVKVTDPAAGNPLLTAKNAKLKGGLTMTTVGAVPETLKASDTGASVAQVKIEESKANIAKDNSTISLTAPDNITFFEPPVAASVTNIELVSNTAGLSTDRKTASWTVKTETSVSAGSFVTTPKVNVGSGFAADTEIKFTLTSSDSGVAVAPASLKVAKTSASDAISFSAGTALGVVKGVNQMAANVTIKENKAEAIKATSGTEDTITIEIDGGSAVATFASTPQGTPTGVKLKNSSGDAVSTALGGSLNGTFTTATWTIAEQSSAAGSLVISNIALNVNATSGLIKVKVYGAALGLPTAADAKVLTVASIGESKDIEILAASTPTLEKGKANQAAGDITIKENKAGALANGTLELKIFGVTADKEVLFSVTPDVAVTSGSKTVTGAASGETTVTATIGGSGSDASTIKVTGIKYDVNTKAANGAVQLIVSVGGTRIGTVVNAYVGVGPAPKFADVPATHWAFSYIENLVAKGIVNGYTDGTFKPSNTITRAEFAKIVAVAKGLAPATGSSFSDTSGHWAAGYIEAVKTAGYIGGYPNGTFRPNTNITRAEIAKIIVVAAGFTTDTSGAGFSDIAGHWASDYILTANNKGIVGGYTDGTFRPNNSATRAEASKMVSIWVNM